ncbi:hypothetical protein BG005_011444 [Podila minutissima]|nr:hypothetical protein BG005_011444 [Podila minutissima]
MATYAPNLPETMKAIHWTKIGKPAEILALDEHQPLPTLTGTNILVKVHASALNPVDWKLMKGGVPRFLMPKVKTPGLDISGVVVGLGPKAGKSNKLGVQKFAIGDRVMAMLDFSKSGGLQEYTLVDEAILVKTPAEWDALAAAAFPLVGTTVYESLVIRGGIKKGDRVLVNGASGGTGSVAVQLATALGAAVVGVCSTANVELAKKLGAAEVVDYTATKVHEQYSNRNFDIILDTVGSDELYATSGTLLKPSGQYIQIAGADSAMDSPFHLLYSGLQILHKKLYGLLTRGAGYQLFTTFPNGANLATAAHILVRANATPTVAATFEFSLDQVLEAYKQSQSGRARGKLVVTLQ